MSQLASSGARNVSGPASAIGLAVWIAICLVAGALGSVFTAQSVGTWYRELARPSWTPPAAVFGPVWTALYTSMGVSAWLVWRRGGPTFVPLSLFSAQLVLNIAWSALFFGLRSPGVAFVEIVALWLLILATLLAFRRISPAAGILLLPYQAWVTFAAALNFALWRMNA
jgi:benzodiazapine receptor